MTKLKFVTVLILALSTPLTFAAQNTFRKIDLKVEPIPQAELQKDQQKEFHKAAQQEEKTFWEIAKEAEEEQETEVHGATAQKAVDNGHTVRKWDISTEAIPEFVGSAPFLTRLDEIPLISQVDQNYTQKRTSDYCRRDWQSIRRMQVNQIAFNDLNFEKIAAMARRAAIPADHLERTLNIFAENQSMIPNQRYIGMIDFNKHTSRRRLFILDLQTGEFEGYMIAHGQGSDPTNSGYPKLFSNESSTNASSLGCAIAGGQAYGGSGRKILYLHGFEKTNDEMCDREVVMHPAKYVGWGRSHGCPALKPGDIKEVYSKLGNGGLVCSYYDGEHMDATKQVRHIKKSKKFKKSKKYKAKSKKYKKSKKSKKKRR